MGYYHRKNRSDCHHNCIYNIDCILSVKIKKKRKKEKEQGNVCNLLVIYM